MVLALSHMNNHLYSGSLSTLPGLHFISDGTTRVSLWDKRIKGDVKSGDSRSGQLQLLMPLQKAVF